MRVEAAIQSRRSTLPVFAGYQGTRLARVIARAVMSNSIVAQECGLSRSLTQRGKEMKRGREVRLRHHGPVRTAWANLLVSTGFDPEAIAANRFRKILRNWEQL